MPPPANENQDQPKPTTLQRWPRIWLVVLCVAGLGCVVGLWLWIGTRTEIPNPDLSQAHAEVVEVLREARSLVEVHRQSGEAWGELGMALAAHDYRDEAVACFREASRRAPHTPQWAYYLGDLLQFKASRDAAEWFERAAQNRSDTTTSLAWIRSAETWLLLDDVELAQLATQHALQVDRTNPRAAFMAARVALSRNDSAAAREAIERADHLQPRHKLVVELHAQILQRLGETKLAADRLKLALSLPEELKGWPDPWLEELQKRRVDPYWQLHLAQQARQRGDLASAQATLESITKAHSEEPLFATWLARNNLDLGRREDAQTVLNAALQIHPKDAELLALRGTCYLLSEHWKEAIADFRAALNSRPDLAATWVDLAFALRQLGQLDEAEAATLSASKLNSEMPEARIELALIHLERGHVSAAQEVFRQHLEKLHPTKAIETLRERLGLEKKQPGPSQ